MITVNGKEDCELEVVDVLTIVVDDMDVIVVTGLCVLDKLDRREELEDVITLDDKEGCVLRLCDEVAELILEINMGEIVVTEFDVLD